MDEKKIITAVIFDWGRTLWDPENEKLFPGVSELLRTLSARYDLFVVSLASKGETEISRRKKLMSELGIEPLFKDIVFVSEEKDEAYVSLFTRHGLLPSETVIVDDRIIRGISWGNSVGAMTVWFQNGKFKDELPDVKTGRPTHHIRDIRKLSELL